MRRSQVWPLRLVDEPASVQAAPAMVAGHRIGLPFEDRLTLNRRRRRAIRVRLALTVVIWVAMAALLVVLPLLIAGVIV